MYKRQGFGNYVRAFEDSGGFTHALWYTALFAGLSTVLINLFGLTVALLLVRGFRGTNLFRTVFFMPNLIGGIVLGWLWQVILNYGVLARYGVTLVTSEWYGFWGLMVVMLWQQAGYMMIIYISGLQSIPGELSEAAAIDGASAWQTLRYVKLPMLMPSITILSLIHICVRNVQMVMEGITVGMVMFPRICHPLAPSILAASITVSYTHLDVYKRQSVSSGRRGRLRGGHRLRRGRCV